VPLGAWKGIPGDGEIPAAGPREPRAIGVGTACVRADSAAGDSAAGDPVAVAFAEEVFVVRIEGV